MNFFEKYVAYLKDNPEGYWFKRKIFGWGWVPAKWQGWSVILIYVGLILALIFSREKSIPGNPDSGSNFLIFALPIIILTIIFLVILYQKGEPTKWQFSFPEKTDKK